MTLVGIISHYTKERNVSPQWKHCPPTMDQPNRIIVAIVHLLQFTANTIFAFAEIWRAVPLLPTGTTSIPES
jgi:hypothetical protein